MTVRVASSWSSPKPVTGGCPQGSILGVFLFNVTTDDLEDDSDYVLPAYLPPPALDPERVGVDEDEDEDYNAPADAPAWGGSPNWSPDCEETLVSTPLAEPGIFDFSPSPIQDPQRLEFRLDDSDVVPNRGAHRIVYSSEEDLTPPPEPTRTCLGQWISPRVEVNKYVDDNLQEESVNFENVVPVAGVKDKHAVATQNVFRHIVRNAERKGMKVNAKKTNMICISDSLHFDTRAHIFDRDGEKVSSGDSLKVLGWHFSSKPTVEAHLVVLRKRFRERYWTLRHLRHNGFSTEDLIKVYKSIVRPVAEYMLEIFHSMMTDAQDEGLERLQTHALKCIYGTGLSGRRMRDLAGLETLRDRRIARCDSFANKCAKSDRFCDWFPINHTRRSARNGGGEKFREDYARCNRLFNSPIYYMRRRLNGKGGKIYGKRNEEYRN